jgi:hypothetical protein
VRTKPRGVGLPTKSAPTPQTRCSTRLAPRDIDAIARRMLVLLAGALAGSLGRERNYSTRRGHAPPGFSDENWKVVAPTIPGAVKRGRWWTVSVEALAAHEGRQAAPAPKPESYWSPEMAATELGLRLVSGSRP